MIQLVQQFQVKKEVSQHQPPRHLNGAQKHSSDKQNSQVTKKRLQKNWSLLELVIKKLYGKKKDTQLFSLKLTLILVKIIYITFGVHDHIKKYLKTNSLMAPIETNLYKDPLTIKVAIDGPMSLISVMVKNLIDTIFLDGRSSINLILDIRC